MTPAELLERLQAEVPDRGFLAMLAASKGDRCVIYIHATDLEALGPLVHALQMTALQTEGLNHLQIEELEPGIVRVEGAAGALSLAFDDQILSD